MAKKQKYYVARDMVGLFLYTELPKKTENEKWRGGLGAFMLPEHILPKVKKKDKEPTEVEIISKKELKKLKKANSNTDITELSDKLDIANELIKTQEEFIEEKKIKVVALSNDRESLMNTVVGLETGNLNKWNKLDKLRKTIDGLRGTVKELSDENKILKGSLDDKLVLEGKVHRLNCEIDNLKKPQAECKCEADSKEAIRMNDIALIDYLIDKKASYKMADISVTTNEIESPIHPLITSDVLVEVLKDTGRDFTISTDEPKIAFSRKKNKDG